MGQWFRDLWPYTDDPAAVCRWMAARCGEARLERLNCGVCDPVGGPLRAPLCGAASDSGEYGTVELVTKVGDEGRLSSDPSDYDVVGLPIFDCHRLRCAMTPAAFTASHSVFCLGTRGDSSYTSR